MPATVEVLSSREREEQELTAYLTTLPEGSKRSDLLKSHQPASSHVTRAAQPPMLMLKDIEEAARTALLDFTYETSSGRKMTIGDRISLHELESRPRRHDVPPLCPISITLAPEDYAGALCLSLAREATAVGSLHTRPTSAFELATSLMDVMGEGSDDCVKERNRENARSLCQSIRTAIKPLVDEYKNRQIIQR